MRSSYFFENDPNYFRDPEVEFGIDSMGEAL